MSKTLIYTAQLPEAQALINFLKLKQDNSVQNLPQETKLFIDENDKYLLVVSGSGKENCQRSLDFIFQNYEINKAINIGIASSSDGSIKVGTIFCTNRLLKNINFASITTIDEELDSDENLETILVDMEAKYFQELSKEYCKDLYTFKVVADHLDIEKPTDPFVTNLIDTSLPILKKYL